MSWNNVVHSLENKVDSLGRKIQDDSLRYNAENASEVGLEARVTRKYDGIGLSNGRDCAFCLERECEDEPYSEAYRKGVFERHDGCKCVIEYVSMRRDKIVKTYQAGKSGPTDWLSEEIFRKRVNYGLDGRTLTPQERNINAAIEMQVRDRKSSTLFDVIIDNHRALKKYTPLNMKNRLQCAGYDILPLSQSKSGFNNKSLEEGGGFKVLFGGDGIFRYHPEGGRHRIAYWTIGNSRKGMHKYDMEGFEVFF